MDKKIEMGDTVRMVSNLNKEWVTETGKVIEVRMVPVYDVAWSDGEFVDGYSEDELILNSDVNLDDEKQISTIMVERGY